MYDFVYICMHTFDSKFKKHQKENVLEICRHNRVKFGMWMYPLTFEFHLSSRLIHKIYLFWTETYGSSSQNSELSCLKEFRYVPGHETLLHRWVKMNQGKHYHQGFFSFIKWLCFQIAIAERTNGFCEVPNCLESALVLLEKKHKLTLVNTEK